MNAWLDDGDLRLYHGDVCDVLRSLPAGVAQTCVTSPPYWGLRDYGTEGQLGLEATPELYVERMVTVFREVWRVLRDDGTLWLNLGDSYAQTEQRHRHDKGPAEWGTRGGEKVGGQSTAVGGLKPKDLCGIPWRVAFALQADGWYLRSDIIWSKPNPMPESVTDRPTKAHEYVFLLSKRPRYFYDADAVRETAQYGRREWSDTEAVLAAATTGNDRRPDHGVRRKASVTGGDPSAGRNMRSVWEVATEPFPEAHFATYPQTLVRRCILAGTSERGECSECGAPWQRETSTEYENPGNRTTNGDRSLERRHETAGFPVRLEKRVETTGWCASCSCGAPTRPQTVLDPFIGSGTTALVARKHGRRCIGIDLSTEYLEIAKRRTQQLSLLGGAA